MGYSFRPAITSEAKPLIGLYSESGCGKTYSALLLAKGFCDDMSKVGMIETESGRGEVYADDPVVGGYAVLPLRDSFAPKEYGAAIKAAGHAGLKALIIDSASHEWEGAGGVLSMAAENQASGKKGPIVWQMPKLEHQREFMLRLLQTSVPLVIVCMRAKYPMKEVVNNGRKEWSRSEFLEPKQADDILFEMMVHAWIDQQHNIHVTKYTKDSFRQIFIDGKPITVDTGKRLAAWARGGISPSEAVSPDAEKGAVIEPLAVGTELRTRIDGMIADNGIDPQMFEAWLFSIKKIGKKYGNPSLSTMSVDAATKMLGAWDATMTAFNLWVDKQAA